MAELINHTAFPALLFDALDQNDAGFSVLAVRLSYDLNIRAEDGAAWLTFCKEQTPLCMADEHYAEPARSSVRTESDLSPYKPRLDVIVNGTAFAPGDKPEPAFGAAVRVYDRTTAVLVSGPRWWKRGVMGWSLTEPAPIALLDLRYELASGGLIEFGDKEFAAGFNNVGMGWYPAEFLREYKGDTLPAPQIESAEHRLRGISDALPATGFGFIGRGWRGRLEFGGTADAAWQEERHPLLPRDFRMDFWNGAPTVLQFPHPKPLSSVPIALQNFVPARDVPGQGIYLQVPVESVFALAGLASGVGLTRDLTLDTIVVDVNARRVYCTYRLALAEELDLMEVQLRYIAADDREHQRQLAARMNPDPATREFVPLPPSLMTQAAGPAHG
ncbi:hypothetical protein DFR29_1082 [Tahibacter aquaticus]|uniref:DUF2169 domain-containing protein n=1 Tax=Tahibacter aquaticus TaxID=520092 RepID=A0A4R6YVA3_9GAMM|nr:DUF2169 domain-containing protein [Tahibacter aquaticus]TDR42419.1 hypothetical protein DFR29_1082 [Tahibacter aquaticus]